MRSKQDRATRERLKTTRAQTLADLGHRFMIHICKDGTISYRDTWCGEKTFNGVALPVFSVDTEAEAMAIQIRFGRLQYRSHPLAPTRPWYRLSSLGDVEPLTRALELDDLPAVTALFRDFIAAQERSLTLADVEAIDAELAKR